MEKKIRVALLALFHETNTYGYPHNPLTTLANFRILTGDAIPRLMRGGGDSASGFVDYAQSHADTFQLCPSVLAIANPSGTIAAETWRELKTMLLKGLEDEIRKNGGIDCVALHLHGAGVSEDSTDLEGILLEEIRALVGPRVVIVANLDLHAKFTPKMHANVDVINAVLTYPHIDHNPRSQQLLALVPGILEGKLKPTRYVERLPFLLVSAPTVPNQGFLMSEVREMCEAAMKKEGVLDCSVLHGFPFSDVAYPGIHVLVTTNGNPGLAKEIALEIARFIWENKERAVPKTISPEQAVEKAKSILSSQGRLDVTPKPPTSTRPDVGTYSFLPDSDGSKPVIIADAADNPGGGSTGDGTYLLKAVWESRVERAAFIGLYDPENVEKLAKTPVGTFLTNLAIGGRSGIWSGAPLIIPRAFLKSVSTSRMTFRGYSSPTKADLGRTVCLVDAETGMHVVLIERNSQVFDDNWMIAHGIVTCQFRLIALKSVVHFRAFFTPARVSEVIISDGQPGLTSHNMEPFVKKRNLEAVWPTDLSVTWDPRGRGLEVVKAKI